MTEQDKDKQLDNVYQKVFRYGLELALKFEWQMIAATFIAIGLRLYKTILSPEEYDDMCNSIKDSMEKVTKYEDRTIH
jgi:hypothetical protein|tara:strand:- start:154 stop:387 length:234 start_codon:yes stop_codon:yes gene_type:complete